MTREEFTSDIAPYIAELFPKFRPTPAQLEIWFHRLKLFGIEECREGLSRAFADGKYAIPRLVDVAVALKSVRRGQAGTQAIPREDISPEYAAQVKRDEEDDDWDLSLWQDVDLESAKENILSHEPELAWCFEKLPPKSRTWKRLIVSRCIEKVVTLYPGGRPMQMAVDVYWAQGRTAYAFGSLGQNKTYQSKAFGWRFIRNMGHGNIPTNLLPSVVKSQIIEAGP